MLKKGKRKFRFLRNQILSTVLFFWLYNIRLVIRHYGILNTNWYFACIFSNPEMTSFQTKMNDSMKSDVWF